MSVRAKFRVDGVYKTEQPNEDWYTVILRPVTYGSEENESFYRWTPGGEIGLQLVREDTAQQFEVGKEYYVDFTPAQ